MSAGLDCCVTPFLRRRHVDAKPIKVSVSNAATADSSQLRCRGFASVMANATSSAAGGGDRSSSCVGRLFDVPFEYGQHACLHDPDNGWEEPRDDETSKPSRAEGFVTTDNETRAPARQLI
jgi:hypothetical protein